MPRVARVGLSICPLQRAGLQNRPAHTRALANAAARRTSTCGKHGPGAAARLLVEIFVAALVLALDGVDAQANDIGLEPA
jgi:hypothetical protein